MTKKQTTGVKKNKILSGDNSRKKAILRLSDWKAIDCLQNTAIKLQITKKEKAWKQASYLTHNQGGAVQALLGPLTEKAAVHFDVHPKVWTD